MKAITQKITYQKNRIHIEIHWLKSFQGVFETSQSHYWQA